MAWIPAAVGLGSALVGALGGSKGKTSNSTSTTYSKQDTSKTPWDQLAPYLLGTNVPSYLTNPFPGQINPAFMDWSNQVAAGAAPTAPPPMFSPSAPQAQAPTQAQAAPPPAPSPQYQIRTNGNLTMLYDPQGVARQIDGATAAGLIQSGAAQMAGVPPQAPAAGGLSPQQQLAMYSALGGVLPNRGFSAANLGG
jgi:hypothetical protein